MMLTTSLTHKQFRRRFLIFFSLASTLPLLIMILGIFQYVLPFLSSDQINGLRDTFTFGALFMLLPPILGFCLMVRWIASFEAMVTEFKTKSYEITGKMETQEEDELTVLHQTFNELFGELKHKMNQVNQYSKKVIDSNIQLSELANIDELTSMYNRRYFNLRLIEEVSRAERYNHCLSLIFIDLDKFKHYNDSLGHPAGDKLLQEFSLLIHQSIRQTDLAFRYGGDEFAILLPGCDVQMAEQVAHKLAKIVSRHEFEYLSGHSLERVTISYGVAGYSQSLEALVAEADKDLYAAKTAGKRQVKDQPQPMPIGDSHLRKLSQSI